MDLSKLSVDVGSNDRPTDPQAVFEGLTLRGTIENVWGPQQEALTLWHAGRHEADTVVQMNTGGGKTLVGLLIAQSLVNETSGNVLYVCPNNQLVEQTAKQAAESGLHPAIRMKGSWTRKAAFDTGETFCITNYAVLFNGFSVFRPYELSGIVFDDAHVAENIVRGQYTISIPGNDGLFNPVAELFRPHFARSSLSSRFQEVLDGHPAAFLFVPLFEGLERTGDLRKLLTEAGIDQSDSKFAWEHLKDHLPESCILLSGTRIEITPPLLPIRSLSFFGPGCRRVYLTATLPTPTSFLRTFGIRKPAVITPGGKSGDAQRLFLFAPGEDDEQQRSATLELLGDSKWCVISPSNRCAADWVPPAELFDSQAGHEQIEKFAEADPPAALALAARYDGIDLPGDACRILILDRLPRGASLLTRLIDESIQVESLRAVNTATRIVQAIGRIFRSNTDHGAVILRGNDLQRWLRSARNREYLPPLLQQQLALTLELDKLVEKGEVTQADLLAGVLEGRADWDQLYSDNIGRLSHVSSATPESWHVHAIVSEREAFEELWNGQYARAATAYCAVADSVEEKDSRLAAWYRHWAGYAYHRAGDRDSANQTFVTAANSRAELGRPSERNVTLRARAVTPSAQATRIAALALAGLPKLKTRVNQVIASLSYENSANVVESALKELGDLLGLDASRPDKDGGTGPDVLWLGAAESLGAALEAKTEKQGGGEYAKSEISQCHDHSSWLESNHKGREFVEAIVGRELAVSNKANPRSHQQLITLEAFHELAQRVKELVDGIETASAADMAAAVERGIGVLGLRWPTCLTSLPSKLLTDLQQ